VGKTVAKTPVKPRPKPARGATARPTADPQSPPAAERIAKVLARAGLASRRDAEEMIRAGRVTVNGKQLDSPALTVTPADRITVDGQPLPAPERPRLWLYHKPAGLVTTARDEQGRPTVFDNLPEEMPRVMPVGRLDLTSEGLLLLTNDGEVKRRMELPSTGWLRKYRVRVHGTPTEAQLAPLKAGIVIEGERFQPMIVGLDRQQGSNAWLTVGLREGRNREIRRAMEAVGLTVNRLIRLSYGPFQLGDLPAGEVREIRAQVLADQLGLSVTDDSPAKDPERPPRRSWGTKSHGGGAAGKPPRSGGPAKGEGTEPSARPRSWGAKSHRANQPGSGPKPPRG
jgi:23S rRNA pseudouridine2605 synthase